MDRDDFRLALKELHILTGFDLDLEDADLPGFKYVKNVKLGSGDAAYRLCVRMRGSEILEVVKFHRKSPRRMSPEEFLKEVGLNIMDGKGATIE